MNLLAIDTCTQDCSVSLYVNGVKFNRLIQGVEKSSGLVLNLCDSVFAQAQLKPVDLNAIIYTRGPGAFTGVRMCLAVVQGISLAHNIPTKGYSTLELIGFSAAKKYHSNAIAVALDARMNEVYWGVYESWVLLNESLKSPIKVGSLNANFIGVGSGWKAFSDVLCMQTGVDNFVTDFYPQAHNLIDLYLENPNFDNQLPLPKYLRDNVAQKSS